MRGGIGKARFVVGMKELCAIESAEQAGECRAGTVTLPSLCEGLTGRAVTESELLARGRDGYSSYRDGISGNDAN
jgi:hypothetical protein